MYLNIRPLIWSICTYAFLASPVLALDKVRSPESILRDEIVRQIRDPNRWAPISLFSDSYSAKLKHAQKEAAIKDGIPAGRDFINVIDTNDVALSRIVIKAEGEKQLLYEYIKVASERGHLNGVFVFIKDKSGNWKIDDEIVPDENEKYGTSNKAMIDCPESCDSCLAKCINKLPRIRIQ